MLEFCLLDHWQQTSVKILIEILTFSFQKMHLKMSSGKWRPFCLGLNVLIISNIEAILISKGEHMMLSGQGHHFFINDPLWVDLRTPLKDYWHRDVFFILSLNKLLKKHFNCLCLWCVCAFIVTKLFIHGDCIIIICLSFLSLLKVVSAPLW